MIPRIQFHPVHHNSSRFHINSVLCHQNSPQMVGWKMTWKHLKTPADLGSLSQLHWAANSASASAISGNWSPPSFPWRRGATFNAQVGGWILMRCKIPWCLKIGEVSFNISHMIPYFLVDMMIHDDACGNGQPQTDIYRWPQRLRLTWQFDQVTSIIWL